MPAGAARWASEPVGFKNQWEKTCEPKKKGRALTALDWQANSRQKKKQVEQQMRVEGKSLWHGHKLLIHNPKQCVTIAVQLDEKTLSTALRKKVVTQLEETVSG